MADIEECERRREELSTNKLWINGLKSDYLKWVTEHVKELPIDQAQFPSSIHAFIDQFSDTYAQNQEAIVAYRAQKIFMEKMNGAAFIPSKSELAKLEKSVLEEERLLDQVQQRLSEKVKQANDKIDGEYESYDRAMQITQDNEQLVIQVVELEDELVKLQKELEEKEKREKDVVEQQTRDLQTAHNELIRETAMCDDMDREQTRLQDRLQRLKSNEKKRRTTVVDSQEQQELVEKWIKTVAPVVNARVENSTLVLTLGDGLGSMSGRRLLVGFTPLGRVKSIETGDGRRLPPNLDHETLMTWLSEQH